MLRLFFQLKMMESLQFIATMYDELMASVGTSTADVTSAPPIRQEIEAKISSVKAGILANPDLTVLPKLKETLEQSGPASRIPIPKSDLEVIGGRAASKLEQIKQGVAAKDIDVSGTLSAAEQAKVSKTVVPPKKAPEPVAPAPLPPASANTAPSTNTIPTFSIDGLVKQYDATPVSKEDTYADGIMIKQSQADDGSVKVEFMTYDSEKKLLGTFIHKGYEWYVNPTTYKSWNFISTSSTIRVIYQGSLPDGEHDFDSGSSMTYQNNTTEFPFDTFVSVPLDNFDKAQFFFNGKAHNGTDPLFEPLTKIPSASANTAPSASSQTSSYRPKIAELGLQKVSDAVQTDGGDKVILKQLFAICDQEADGSMKVSFSDGDQPSFAEFYHIDYCWYVKPSDYKYYNILPEHGDSINVQTNSEYYRQSDDRYLKDASYQASLLTPAKQQINLKIGWIDNMISLDDLKSASWWFKGTTNNGSEPLPMPFTSNQASANTAPSATSGSSVDLTKWVEYPITAYPAPDLVPVGRDRNFAPVNMEGQQINIVYAEVDDIYSTLTFSLPTGQILNEYLIDHSDVPAAPAKMYVNPQHRYYNFDNNKTVKISFSAFDRNQNRKQSIVLDIVDDGLDYDRVEWIYGGDSVKPVTELPIDITIEIKNPMLKQASFKIIDLNSSIGKKEIVNFRNPLTAKPFVANDNKQQGRLATGMLFVLEDGGIIDVYGYFDPGMPMLGSDGKLNLFNYDPKPITQFQLDYNTNEIIPTMNTKPLDLFNRNLTDAVSYDNRTNKSLGEFRVSTDKLVGAVSHLDPVNNAPRSTGSPEKAAQLSSGYQLVVSMASSKVTNWPQDESTMFWGISFLLLGSPNIIDPLAEPPDTGKFDAPVIADDNTIDFSQLYPLATNGPGWSQNESTSPPSEQDIEFVGVNIGEARFVYRDFENGARVEMSANYKSEESGGEEKMQLINEFYYNTSNDRWYAEPGKYKMIDMGQYFIDSDKGFQMRYYQAWDKNNYLYMDNAPAYYQMCMNIEGTHHTQGTYLQSVSLSKFNNDGIYFEDQAQGRKTSNLYYAVAVPKDAKPTITYYGTLDHSEDFSGDLRELTSHPPALGTQTYANIADMYVYLQHYANGSQTLEFSYDDLASGERVILNRFIRPSGAPVWMFNKPKNPHQKYNVIDVVSSDGLINFHVDIRNADTSLRTDARMMLGSEPAGIIRCGESAKIHPVYALAQSWMTFATDSGVGIAVIQPNIGGPYTLFDRKSI